MPTGYERHGYATLEMGIIFFAQTGVGILGNSSLLFLYNFSLLTGYKLRPTDQIVSQLVLANNLVLFSRGIPQTMAAFGWKSLLDDAGCKLVFYLHRVARGVSLGTTCLLSGFQAFKFFPRTSWWLDFRNRSPKYIGFCSFLLWILQLLVNIHLLRKVTGPRSSKNASIKTNYVYCSSHNPDIFITFFHAVLLPSIDLLCLAFMLWTSGSMVLLLHRHKRRVQYLHSHSLSPRPSHEARATLTILILVTSFVLFYCLSSILTLCVTVTVNPRQWLTDTAVLIASCFPAFSPFVLISSDARISLLFNFCTRKNYFPNLIQQL
ncbi:vomeronasal type-1 receptor 1 [Manis pentadactyla]|uniref:vomeronasal type-1 receptor 1 n=1 Tax=Manis pentadactyla TaxID=143292 RepID=UPI00255CA4D5|nr:vomeronasal type-1 receptor 1 [Manis pentadactyla]